MRRRRFARARCDSCRDSLQRQVCSLVKLRKFPVYESRFERFDYAVTEQKKIFGTDGVRGVANVEPMTEFGFHIRVIFC